tara:strand:+ start:846 stop:1016 length:171 start_codon:yes stop_codon:yes gene_type:complete
MNNSFSFVKTTTISWDLISINSKGFLLMSALVEDDKNKNVSNKFLFKRHIALLYTC